MSGGLLVERVTKRFPGDVVAVDDVTLEVGADEFLVLVGPSGCGKTTLLRLIAGLEDVTAGRIYLRGEDVTHREPKDRDIAMVFQDYALYPHMTVAQNMGFGLRLRKEPKAVIRARVQEAARMLAVESLLDRKPAQLSGGQRQRVAMGRAIVREPRAFLMDEPLSNLDAMLRVQTRAELALLRERLRTTTVYVTHDQVEAMTLGDRVAVMDQGVIQQVDRPQTLFERPSNLFVASFIGSPPMNLFEATIASGHVEFAHLRLPVDRRPDLAPREGARTIVGIRPSSFEDARLAADRGQPTIDATVDVVEHLGDEAIVVFTVPGADAGHRRGGKLAAKVSPRTDARPGERIRLAVDEQELHFFDPETGQAIGDPGAAPRDGARLVAGGRD